jgi:flagellar protein FlgJ
MLAADASLTHRLAADAQSLDALRSLARKDAQAGVKAAAQQFEAYFLQMVMKGMRDAMPADGPFDSDASRLYTGLLDQQFAQRLAGHGGVGFARMIEAQLTARQRGFAGDEPPTAAARVLQGLPVAPAAPASTNGQGLPLTGAPRPHPVLPAPAPAAAEVDNGWRAATAAGRAVRAEGQPLRVDGDSFTDTPRDFVSRVWPHAVEAAAEIGVPPHFLVAQAALESGWGRHEPRRADGSPSYNLFGIKAGRQWSGEVVSAPTDEYIDGQRLRQVERFRAYDSYGDAFRDYARLIAGSPRYAAVVGAGSGMEFAKQLQQAGYASDPMYADKLARIIHGETLRGALLG